MPTTKWLSSAIRSRKKTSRFQAYRNRCTAAAVVAGCLIATSPLPAYANDDLEGTAWRFAVLAGKTVGIAGDIRFEDGAVSGSTACNHFGGVFKRSGTNGIAIKVGRMTRRGCSGPAAELERDVLEAMAATNSFELRKGALHLLKDTQTVASLNPMPVLSLEGNPLKIVSFLKDGGLHSIPPERQPNITFMAGKFAGNTGCTTITGTYVLDGDKISAEITGTTATKSPCPDEFSDQDAGIREALPNAFSFDSYRNLIRILQKKNDWAVLWLTPVASN